MFDRSTTASDCCDANRGRFDDWVASTGESDAFECEVDNAKEALVSKLAVILFMECEARIDDWSDRELILRLALVLSLEEGRDEVVEGSNDRGGVDSKLAVILLPFIKVDADEDMEVFAALDLAMAAAAVTAAAAAVAAAAAAVAAVAAAAAAAATVTVVTFWAALSLFCFLQIAMPSRKTSFKSLICQMSSSLWRELGLSIFLFRAQ